MATTNFGANDPQTVKLWSKALEKEIIRETYFDRFTDRKNPRNSLCLVQDELQKAAGDRVRIKLLNLLDGAGVRGSGTLEGNEESLEYSYDDLLIDDLAWAVRFDSRMGQQRVEMNLRKDARHDLGEWFSDRMDQAFFNHLCGNTAQTDLAYTGLNAVSAPSSSRQIFPGSATTDQGLGSGDTFTLELIDYAVEQARTATPVIKPIRWMGENYYIVFIHDYQWTDIRTNTATGQFQDIQKSAMDGGRVSDNPIFKGYSFIHGNAVVFVSNRITNGVHSTAGTAVSNTKRAVLCGAGAMAMGYGRANSGDNRWTWTEEVFDYGRKKGVAAMSIHGMKSTKFTPNSGTAQDYGKVVISTYAAAHT